jgi:GntR family transcriptional regulator
MAPTRAPEKSSRKTRGTFEFRPLYAQVKDAMIQNLVSGAWRPGDKLPSETNLAEEYGVSQGTMRKALDDLAAQNLVVRQQGRGTFIATHKPEHSPFHFFHLVGNDGSRQTPDSAVLGCGRRAATAQESARLGLSAGAQVIAIERVRSMDATPIIFERIVVSAKAFPDLCTLRKEDIPNKLYQLYEDRWGITIYQTVEQLRAVAADAREADLLGITQGTPLQEIDRVALSLERKPVEWRVSHCYTRDYHYLSQVD